MSRILAVISAKGGTGKTTLTSNLGVALEEMGKDVLLVDGNISGSNLAQHFGIGGKETSLEDVFKEDAMITQVATKSREGVLLIPASPAKFGGELPDLSGFLKDFAGKDLILIDAAAGINAEVKAAVKAADGVLIVSNPLMPSVTNAAGAKELAESEEKEIVGVVLNKVREEEVELKDEEVEEVLGASVIGKIPVDPKVRKGIAQGEPIVAAYPSSKASRSIKELAYSLCGEEPPGFSESFLEKVKSAVGKLSKYFKLEKGPL